MRSQVTWICMIRIYDTDDSVNENIKDHVDEGIAEDNVEERVIVPAELEPPAIRRSQRVTAKPHRFTPSDY